MPSNDETESSDILPSLLDGSPFKIKPDEEKLSILQKGRPLPKLEIVKRDSAKNCNRTFQESWYNVHKWLCGSTLYNKLFCWPCTLMRPESSSWCSTGNDDMKRLSSIASKHSKCHMHLKAIAEYDATLIGLGLLPEFVSETSFGCKEEQEQQQDSESEEDFFDVYFPEETKAKKIKSEGESNQAKFRQTSEGKKSTSSQSQLQKGQITFKVWQELNKPNFPITGSKFMEERKLFKWKQKLAKQELKNSQLTGQKIKIEIELLKAKLDYYKSLHPSAINLEENTKQATLIIPAATAQTSISGSI